MRKKLLIFISMLLMLTLISSYANASTNSKPVKTIIKTVLLQPSADTEKILPEFKMTVWSDKSITVSAQNRKIAGSEPEYYHWEVNPETQKYKITMLPVPKEFSENKVSGINVSNNTTGDFSIMAFNPGMYSAHVIVITDDPVGWDVARTDHYMTWNVYTDGTVGYYSRTYTTWGANPSPANTHWYVLSSGFNGVPYYEDMYTHVSSEVNAGYYNYDFMNINLPTYSDHWSKIKGNNDASFYYYWSVSSSGEYYYLLDGDAYAE